MILRALSTDDSWFTWCLAHQAGVREASMSTGPIGWQQHKDWLTAYVHATDRLAGVVELEGEAAGLVRADPMGAYTRVSVAVCVQHRGMGVGIFGVQRITALAKRFGKPVRAEVKMDNEPSIRLFQRCGYQWVGSREPNVLILEAA